MKRFAHAFTYFLVGLFVIGGGIIIYFQNIDGVLVRKPISFTVDTQGLQTDRSSYHKGDTVYVKIAYCRHRSYAAKTQWKLVNETLVFFPDQSYVLQPECSNRWIRIGEIPSYATLGLHHFEGSTEAYVNPLHTFYFNYRSVDFDVIK